MRQPVAPSGATQGMNQAYADKNAGGMLQPAPGETYQGYQNRVNRLTTLPTAANQSLSTQNRDSIPNMEYNNDQILKLLEKKDLDVGPVASWVAGNTKGITLTPDQQEIQKYLEQRSRQEATRSNQDQDSVYKAYGSFGTSKPALRDIIYNDKGVLASQKLYNQGILNVQGNPNKPNLSAINNFEQNYTKLAGDRNLVNLMGVIGDKSLEQLSNTDRQHLKKVFGNMSQDQINDLFAKRQQLLNLVNGR
jgi:hypothetical protein